MTMTDSRRYFLSAFPALAARWAATARVPIGQPESGSVPAQGR